MTVEENKNILKNLKKYEKEFEKKDKARKNAKSSVYKQQDINLVKNCVMEKSYRSICYIKTEEYFEEMVHDSDGDRSYEKDCFFSFPVVNFLFLTF
jgi:hypothetical protein